MSTPNQQQCECEHVCHFEKQLSPNGNPGHKYGVVYAGSHMRQVKTDYGTFIVCKDCADDCMKAVAV